MFLHMLLATLDERDLGEIPDSQYPALVGVRPSGWLPFIPDSDLASWRDVIAGQIPPQGRNQTFEILGSRIGMTADEMVAFIRDPKRMSLLWENLPQSLLTGVEEAMYRGVRAAVVEYLT